MKEKNTIAKIFQQTASKYPEKTALIFQGTGESWTFRQLDEYSNQVANFFYGQGFRSGDVVALFMESRNQYVGLWLGLAKIGVETALVNSNLRMEALLHCITISSSKAVIFGVEMMEGEGSVGLVFTSCGKYSTVSSKFQQLSYQGVGVCPSPPTSVPLATGRSRAPPGSQSGPCGCEDPASCSGCPSGPFPAWSPGLGRARPAVLRGMSLPLLSVAGSHIPAAPRLQLLVFQPTPPRLRCQQTSWHPGGFG